MQRCHRGYQAHQTRLEGEPSTVQQCKAWPPMFLALFETLGLLELVKSLLVFKAVEMSFCLEGTAC